jgi:large subunit ribosomal protein L30
MIKSVAEAIMRNAKKRLQVTLYRGVVGLPKKVRDAARQLGFKRTHQTLWLKVSPYNVGQLVKLKELIRLKIVNEEHVPKAGYLKTPTGFHIVGNVLKSDHI